MSRFARRGIAISALAMKSSFDVDLSIQSDLLLAAPIEAAEQVLPRDWELATTEPGLAPG